MTLQLDREIMRKLWDCYYVPTVKGYFGSFGRFRSDDAKTGDIIALVGSTAGATYFPDQVNMEDGASYTIECTMLPVPTFAGGESAHCAAGSRHGSDKIGRKHRICSDRLFKVGYRSAAKHWLFCIFRVSAGKK